MDKNKVLNIVVLDDSEFYNKMLSKQLEYYLDELSMDYGIKYDLKSYVNSKDCLRNLKADTDIAFLDYYLGDGVTGSDVMKIIKEKCTNCRVVILSQLRNIKTATLSIKEGALDFIYKDAYALPRSCFIIEDVMNLKI